MFVDPLKRGAVQYGKIEVAEQIFRQCSGGPEIRPFTRSAEVVCRGCSEPLQRAIVDVGADAPAARIPHKLQEHDGIDVSASTCWPIVLRHAAAIAGVHQRAWMETQKDRLKQSRLPDVVEELQRFVEDDTVPDPHAPVRAAHRYLTKRPGQFNYQDALAAKLPIGSGEIESAHRYVIHDRLKRAGAWWKLKNAKHMLALRVCRANGDWGTYWRPDGQLRFRLPPPLVAFAYFTIS